MAYDVQIEQYQASVREHLGLWCWQRRLLDGTRGFANSYTDVSYYSVNTLLEHVILEQLLHNVTRYLTFVGVVGVTSRVAGIRILQYI